MAKKAEIFLSINTKKAVQSIDELNNEIDGTVKSVSDLRKTSAALEEQLESADFGSVRFNELKSALVETNKALKDYDLSVESLDTEQRASEFGSFAAGIADTATSAIALSSAMGITDESSIQMIETLASGMAIAQGFRGGIEGIISFQKLLRNSTLLSNATQARSVALTVADTTAKGAQTVATGAQTVATGGATIATKILNSVMKANPVILLIGGITTLVGTMALYSAASEKAARLEKKRLEIERKRVKTLERINKRQKEQADFVGQTSSKFIVLIEKLKKTNENSKERRELMKDINDEYGTTLKNLKDETFFQNQLNLVVDEYIRQQTRKFKLRKQEEYLQKDLSKRAKLEQELAVAENKRQQIFTETGRNIIGDIHRIQSAITQADEAIKSRAEYILRLSESNATLIKDTIEIATKAIEDIIPPPIEVPVLFVKSDQEMLLPPEFDPLEMKIDDVDPAIFTPWEEAIADFTTKWKTNWQESLLEVSELAVTAFGNVSDVVNDLLDVQAENASIRRQDRYARETESLKSQLANRELNQKQFNERTALLEQKKEQQELAAKRKAFKRDKANNIIGATMTTAMAVLNALTVQPAVLAPFFAAAAGALGAAQVGIIASQNFRAARGGVVPGNGPSNVDSVNALLAPGETVINSQASSMFPQLLSSINQAGGGVQLVPSIPSVNTSSGDTSVFKDNSSQAPIRAYVVESEITDRQEEVSRIERNAEF